MNTPDDYELEELIQERIQYNTQKWRYSLDPRDPDYLEEDSEEEEL